MNGRSHSTMLVSIAMVGAALIMAFQVAGKAARDALFLSNFRARNLPAMMMAGALAAILLGVGNSRLLTRYSPARMVPTLLVWSGLLQLLEWYTFEGWPDATAVAVYIHVISLGAVITSGFWSVVNEQLDPYTAKQNFGRIAAAGTAGGVAGGFVAERIAALGDSETVLLFMAGIQIITGILLYFLPRTPPQRETEHLGVYQLWKRSAYLRNLSALVLLGTFSAALLDYVLKAEARFELGPGDPLLRFFAMFHTATALLSFVLQTSITPRFLNRWGIGPAVSSLPASVAGGGALAMVTGGFSMLVTVRGLEAAVRGSLFRAGYELYYTPMPASEKRAVKSINDVTLDRLGDGFGGGVAQLALYGAGTAANPIMLGIAAVAAGMGWLVSRRLNAGYIDSLERSLSTHGADLETADDDVVYAAAGLDTVPITTNRAGQLPAPAWMPPTTHDQWDALQSGERERISVALTRGPALERALVPHVVPLLARRSLSEPAVLALKAVADRNVGQLSDYLLDRHTHPAVRTKLPHIIAAAGTTRALDALLRGLHDEYRPVRVQCARALDELKQATSFEVNAEEIYAVIRRELASVVSPAGADLDHVFTLVGLILPREPVRIAREALDTEDVQLRGLALEYLESALPQDISSSVLQAFAELPVEKHPHRPAEVVRQDLLSMLRRTGSDAEDRATTRR